MSYVAQMTTVSVVVFIIWFNVPLNTLRRSFQQITKLLQETKSNCCRYTMERN